MCKKNTQERLEAVCERLKRKTKEEMQRGGSKKIKKKRKY